MVVALSALWLTLFHPRTEGGDLLFLFRLLAGTGMFTSLLLGSSDPSGDSHGTGWMTRAYALALGPVPRCSPSASGRRSSASDRSTALLQGAGWAINLAVAEWFIRRGPARRSAHVIAAPR